MDRTPRNTNMLLWHKRLWLIDHGAALYFHHTWTDYLAQSRRPFAAIKQHVFLPFASALPEAEATLRSRLTPEIIQTILSEIPDIWLDCESRFATPDEQRAAYQGYLCNRLEAAPIFVEEALRARSQLV